MDTIACSLSAAGMAGRAAEWKQLRDTHALGAEPIPRGLRLWLRAAAWDDAVDLARREGECCPFLDLAVTRHRDRIRLDITSESAEARPVIEALAGRC